MKRLSVVWVLVACVVTAALTYFAMTGQMSAALSKASQMASEISAKDASIEDLQKVVTEKESTLLGYTEYRKYLTAGKRSLAEQAKLLTARVTRKEGYTNYLTTSWLGLKSSGAVKVSYKAEYSFGYDLAPNSYDVRPAGVGIEILVHRPILVAEPAVTNLTHQILSNGVFTDENAAVIALQQEAAKRAKDQGVAMTSDPAVVALCEKQLIAVLYDFLAKQPGVKVVPHITVVYR